MDFQNLGGACLLMKSIDILRDDRDICLYFTKLHKRNMSWIRDCIENILGERVQPLEKSFRFITKRGKRCDF